MIINANALHIPLADKSVHMICTSPPYWGLRNYGVNGQLGLERTPEEYIANMVAVFRECWRVLRDDGIMFVNIGDSYYGSNQGRAYHLKPKDLVGIPWRLAFALQADGWYLRSDIIWSKPNPMPESVTDRPTKSHEYLFLLAKQERYFYDAEAIREPYTEPLNRWGGETLKNDTSKTAAYKEMQKIGNSSAMRVGHPIRPDGSGRNKRSVWTIPTKSYSGAHFATFPPALVEPCIKAGTSERGACPKCGKGWRRVIEKGNLIGKDRGGNYKGREIDLGVKKNGGTPGLAYENIMLGWQPACTCDAGEHEYNEGLMCNKCQRAKWVIEANNLLCQLPPIPCLVFDPFVGSGTTVKVAYDLGRRGVGLDLSLDYLDEQARKRIHNGHIARLF